MLLVLEDNPTRISGFRLALSRVRPGMLMRVWGDAHQMIREADQSVVACRAISLDHDLESLTKGHDPGDGLDVVKWLVTLSTPRPVIVHSSNSARAEIMIGELQLAGWPYCRIAPIGDDWITSDWANAVSQVLR